MKTKTKRKVEWEAIGESESEVIYKVTTFTEEGEFDDVKRISKSFIRQLLAQELRGLRMEIEKNLSNVTQQPFDMAIGDSKDFERGFKQGFKVCWNKMLDELVKIKKRLEVK